MEVGGERHAAATLPPGKTRYLLYRRLGGPQSRSGRVRKISPSPGFDPHTVQPVASRYTDCAMYCIEWTLLLENLSLIRELCLEQVFRKVWFAFMTSKWLYEIATRWEVTSDCG
jgi:hypothetical protein